MPGQPSPERLQAVLATQSNLPVTQIFKLLERVGKGAYGSVYKSVHVATGSVVAMKIVDLDQPEDDIDDIQKEVALLSDLHANERSNITSYYGCWLDGPRVWIAMDFAQGGSIRTLMKACKGGIVDERYVVLIIREVLVALSFLHHSNVIHRDLKAANVLLTATGRILLCDFGVSARLIHNHSKRTTFVGTPYWMAPEVIQQSQYDTKADIWSLGITLYEMVTGAPPHAKEDQMRALLLIPRADAPRLPETTGTKDMRDFVASVLREQPADRPTSDELQRSKWIKAAAKTSLSALKELITQYQTWLDQGGTRISVAGDMPWEEEIPDPEDINPWEFDTVRGHPLDYVFVEEPDDDTTPVEKPRAQPPPSLRELFEQASLPADPLSQPRRIAIPTLAAADIGPPIRRIEIPDSEQVESPSPSFFDPANMHTARPDDFAFPRRTHEPSSSSVSKNGRVPGRQRDIEKSQRSPSLSTTYPDSDKDLTAPSRTIFADEDRREQSPQRTRRKDGSPATFTFPSTSSVKVPPSSNSSPTLTPQPPEPVSGPSNHSEKVSSDENHPSGPLAPPPLSRSQSAAPYVPQDNSGFVRPPPPRPQPARQLSASVLDSRTRPFRSASTSIQNESASTLSVPKPSALREALNLSLVPEGGLAIDMLPPSPSAISPLHRHFGAAPSNLGSSPTIPDTVSSTREHGDTLFSKPSEEDGNSFRLNNQSPPHQSSGIRGPTIRPLDYSLLATSEAVHAELSQTVADLSQWLEVIDHGLTSILASSTGDATDDILEQYSNEYRPIQSDS